MELPSNFLGRLINYKVRDNQQGVVKAIQKEASGEFQSHTAKKYPGKKHIPSSTRAIEVYKKLRAFKISLLSPTRVKPHIPKPGKPADYRAVVSGDQHKKYHEGRTCLHGVPHIQQGSANGCLDACQEMALQYYGCKTPDQTPGHRSKSGIFVMADTGRKLTQGLDNEKFRNTMADHQLELKTVDAFEPGAVQESIKQGPMLANIGFANGLSQHSVLVVGMVGDKVVINDPWHGGHQVKSLQWLQKNLVKDAGALSLIARSEASALPVTEVPHHVTGKAGKLLGR